MNCVLLPGVYRVGSTRLYRVRAGIGEKRARRDGLPGYTGTPRRGSSSRAPYKNRVPARGHRSNGTDGETYGAARGPG